MNELAIHGELLPREERQLSALGKLAEEAKSEHAKGVESLRRGVVHYLNAGKKLREAKLLLQKENQQRRKAKQPVRMGWEAWFHEQEFAFFWDTARRYMRLYAEWKTVEEKIAASGNPTALSDLTATDALAVLRLVAADKRQSQKQVTDGSDEPEAADDADGSSEVETTILKPNLALASPVRPAISMIGRHLIS